MPTNSTFPPLSTPLRRRHSARRLSALGIALAVAGGLALSGTAGASGPPASGPVANCLAELPIPSGLGVDLFVDFDALRAAGLVTTTNPVASSDPSSTPGDGVGRQWALLYRSGVAVPLVVNAAVARGKPTTIGVDDARCSVESIRRSGLLRIADASMVDLSDPSLEGLAPVTLDGDLLRWGDGAVSDDAGGAGSEVAPATTPDDDERRDEVATAMFHELVSRGALQGYALGTRSGDASGVATLAPRDGDENPSLLVMWSAPGRSAADLESGMEEAVAGSLLAREVDVDQAEISAAEGTVTLTLADVPMPLLLQLVQRFDPVLQPIDR